MVMQRPLSNNLDHLRNLPTFNIAQKRLGLTRGNTMKKHLLSASIWALACLPLVLTSGCTPADDASQSGEQVTTAGEADFAERPLWGDTHLHTSYSFDVFMFGTPTSTPENAYRFALGEAVESATTGETWQLDRPLDFLMVTDHAEALGTVKSLFDGDAELAETKSGRALLAIAEATNGVVSKEGMLRAYHFLQTVGTGAAEDKNYGVTPKAMYVDLHAGDKRKTVWTDIIETADRYNTPGKFTTFIGWEWTSHPGGANLHRNIFTPVGADVAKNFLPFSASESPKPEDLWDWLKKTREAHGADFVAMPHNPNVSNGRMFQLEDSDGNPIDADYARRRMEWERVVEVTQIKGDSETHPNLSPTDEFAEFETWNFVMLPDGPTPEPGAAEYARSALKRGLEIEKETGVNPYKFGMIGSTDSHTGLSTSSENAFAGKVQKDSTPEFR